LSKFSDWEFLLNGDVQEFRQLSLQAGSSYFNIYGGVDDWLDCPNEDFRMTSLYCEGESDPEVVWQLGYELVSLFNGASILFSKNYRKTSIFELLHNEKPVNYVSPKGASALLGKPSGFSQQRIDQEYKNGSKSTIKFPLIHLATENKDIYFILKYLNMSESWTTYYKLMEAVETFAKEKDIDLKTANDQRKSFTNTSNNFSLSGFDARHGFKEVTKRNNTSAMSIDEGYNFVSKMSRTYIKKAYFNTSDNFFNEDTSLTEQPFW
jgi:hypothetical protein